ncbi:MAG: F0F1 ATP synthase subunit epsilon, partial [Dehalococcoidia bacterium]|nr:F0F1 ATP synthase subunit epsilon [Dehalococcoidia bacterium]
MAKQTLRFEIISADRVVYSDDVDVVVAPGVVGELAVLPNHAPLMTVLQIGEIRVKKDGQEVSLFTNGGFLEVNQNKVLVLSDSAERAEEIDLTRAEAAKKRAEERLKHLALDMDLARVEAALKRAMTRVNIGGRRKKGGPIPP